LSHAITVLIVFGNHPIRHRHSDKSWSHDGIVGWPDANSSGSAESHWNHALDLEDRILGRLGFYQVVRPLAAGIVLGLAESAAVAVFVLTTICVPDRAVLYRAVFGIGIKQQNCA
jgi:hypothetical protein